jgi:imidazolonepropionase-like amidohydrolase
METGSIMKTRLSGVMRAARMVVTLACALIFISSQTGASFVQEKKSEIIESGRFRIYKLQYAVGFESYETRREADGSLSLDSDFEINYLGERVALAATLRTDADLTPRHLTAKGRTSTRSEIDLTVDVTRDSVTLREGQQTNSFKINEGFFPSAGLLPVSMQETLFRYHKRHQLNAGLMISASERVMFERRGTDRFKVGGREFVLYRYSASGLVWGRETLWFDQGQRLIAVISADAELDRMEAVREGYEALLPQLVARAAHDAVADLERISSNIRPLYSGRYAIRGATLLDGTGRAPIQDSVILIDGERITAAGTSTEVKIPPRTRVMNARGNTILPGLWDMHAHAEQSEWIQASLAAGITTMRDAGNEPEFILPVRRAIHEGRVTGPRILLAGIVDSPPNALGNNIAATPEEARALVRRYHQLGYEQVKIYQSLKPELVRVVSDEAHRLKMTVTGHVPTGMNAFEAVEAGMDQINHIGFILRAMRGRDFRSQPGVAPPPLDLNSTEAQSAIRFFKERGTVVDPTLARGELNLHSLATPFAQYEPSMPKVPPVLAKILNQTGLRPEQAARAMPVNDLAGKLAVRLARAGVPLVAGTDLVVPGHSIYRELELYVRAGMTPMETLQAATIVPARVMKLDKELGTIEAGKIADLILVDGNPLENISALRRVRFVSTRGRLFASAPFWQSVGFKS